MIRRAAVVALTIGVLACPAGASAAPKWLEPDTIFDQTAAQGATVAMAPDGTAMIARASARSRRSRCSRRLSSLPESRPRRRWKLARSGAGKSISLREASAGPDGRFVIPYDENGFHQVTLAPDGRLIDRFDNLPGGVTLRQRAILDARGGANYLADANGIAVYRIAAGAGRVLPIPFPPGKHATDIPDEPSLVGTPDGRLLLTYVTAGLLPGGTSCDGVTDVWLNEGTGDTLAPAAKVISGRVTGVPVAGECTNVKGLVRRYPAVGADAAGTTTIAFHQGGESDGSLSVGVVQRPAGGSWGPVESVGPSIEGPLRATLAGSTTTVTVESIIVMWAARSADGRWRPPAPLYAHFNAFDMYNAVAFTSRREHRLCLGRLEQRGAHGASRPCGRNPRGAHHLEQRARLAASRRQRCRRERDRGLRRRRRPGATRRLRRGRADRRRRQRPRPGRARRAAAVHGPLGPRRLVADGIADVAVQRRLERDRRVGRPRVRRTWDPLRAVAGDRRARQPHDGDRHGRGRGGAARGRTRAAPPPAAAPRDATAPVFTTKPKVRGGALRFALSEPARVVAVITRKATGVRRGKRCVAPPRRKTKARKCTRQVAVATVRATFKPGAASSRSRRRRDARRAPTRSRSRSATRPAT